MILVVIISMSLFNKSMAMKIFLLFEQIALFMQSPLRRSTNLRLIVRISNGVVRIFICFVMMAL